MDTRMTSDYAAGRINKMDNKLLYDHLTYHNIDYFQLYSSSSSRKVQLQKSEDKRTALVAGM